MISGLSGFGKWDGRVSLDFLGQENSFDIPYIHLGILDELQYYKESAKITFFLSLFQIFNDFLPFHIWKMGLMGMVMNPWVKTILLTPHTTSIKAF